MGWREVIKLPRVMLYDERQRLWGFFLPDEASMLKKHSSQEWFAIGLQLLAGRPTTSERLLVIPFEDDAESIRGKFYLTPWSDAPCPPPPGLTEEEIAELNRSLNEPGTRLSWDEFMDQLDRDFLEDDPENGETGSSA
jgi:hypothetical protein